MKLITLHLPPQWIHLLDEAVGKGLYPNRSEMLRYAIFDFIRKEQLVPKNTTLHWPKRVKSGFWVRFFPDMWVLKKADQLVQNGHVRWRRRSDVINCALVHYFKELELWGGWRDGNHL